MNIQLETKGISKDAEQLKILQSMLKNKRLAIPPSKKGVLTVEKIFTFEYKKIVFRCELDINFDNKCHVRSSRRSKLIAATQSAFPCTLDQLASIT